MLTTALYILQGVLPCTRWELCWLESLATTSIQCEEQCTWSNWNAIWKLKMRRNKNKYTNHIWRTCTKCVRIYVNNNKTDKLYIVPNAQFNRRLKLGCQWLDQIRQVVNPRHLKTWGQSVAKPETGLWNVLSENENLTHKMSMATNSIWYSKRGSSSRNMIWGY